MPAHRTMKHSALLATAAVAVILASTATATAAVANAATCAPYTDFPVGRSSQRCFFSNTCYAADLCCPSTTSLDSACIDATTYRCGTAEACADLLSPAGGNYTPADLYLRALGGGGSIQCCPREFTTTPAPSVPPLGGDDGTGADDGSGRPQPEDVGCSDPIACKPNLVFARIIRALCPEIPSIYDDEFLNVNLPMMCCYFVNATPPSALPPNGRDYACGSGLLDLPNLATYHCNFNLRGTQLCCNGRVDPPSDSSSAVQRVSIDEEIRNRGSLVYTYEGSVCTDRLIYPSEGDSGDSAASVAGITTLAYAVVALLFGIVAFMPNSS